MKICQNTTENREKRIN